MSLTVKDKEFLVLVGPSGCGKTTALRCIAGLEDVTSGQILIDDQVVNDIPPKDRDIAMVFQSYALYPHVSVFDNMAFGLKLRKMPKDEIYVYLVAGKKDLIARVDPRSKWKIGEKVKVAIDMNKFFIFDPEKNPENPVAIR